ncbi:MAG: hypothetical protein US81_C0017G0004 [Parcubacteria group bacterium GW2011_GWE2_38_18]|nr:MAG: hypothetical protein US81_C0017G0004 [Parcubacteria group bacterium GW2011_GWE2_38_18]
MATIYTCDKCEKLLEGLSDSFYISSIAFPRFDLGRPLILCKECEQPLIEF